MFTLNATTPSIKNALKIGLVSTWCARTAEADYHPWTWGRSDKFDVVL